MQWTDLKRLDNLILETQSQGAQIEEIGISGEGRLLYGVTVGDPGAARTVSIIAGCHASEIIGPLAAVSMLQTLVKRPIPGVKFRIVPIVDPDFLYRNAEAIPSNATLRDLLSPAVNHYRDLEGNFTTDIYPECIAVCQWLRQTEQIDAYFSLHSAGLISPGLFFYVGSNAHPRCVDRVSKHVAAAVPAYIPLLPYDPTGETQTVLASGFLEIPISDIKNLDSQGTYNSLTFIAHHFQPKFIGVSEMPLAICPALYKVPLSEIDRCNREFSQTGHIAHPFQDISLNTQLSIMRTFIEAAALCISNC
ncbi:MAG: M14 family zinc carboxypeptidase [Cyanobacteria bacterium J06633_2]